MDVDLEIHSPGLNLHHRRWNYHVLFMDKVHENLDRIVDCAKDYYREHGRGTMFVNRSHWMTVIKDEWNREETVFPCTYKTNRSAASEEFGSLRRGFQEMIEEYDPETQLVLTVEHRSVGMLSSYLIRYSGSESGGGHGQKAQSS